jgi:hypothetical protein
MMQSSLLAVVARRLALVRKPVSRRVSVLRQVKVSLFECSFSVLALPRVRGTILVAQLANGTGVESCPSESADKSPDAQETP